MSTEKSGKSNAKCASWTKAEPPGGQARRELLVPDFQHLVLPHPSRGLHFDPIARVLADDRPRDRRADGYLPFLDVRFVVADDLVGHGLAVLLLQVDGRAEHAAPFRVEQLGLDDLSIGELGLDLLDPALDEALALLGRVVLGVLRQVTVGARFRDRRDRVGTFDGLQPLQLLPQQLRSGRRQRYRAHIKISIPAPWAPDCGIGYSRQKRS